MKISHWKRTASTCWCKRDEKYLLFLKTLAVSIHSLTFQGLSALKECLCMSSFRTCSICDKWKGSLHYRVHSPYKGHLSIADNLAWSYSVRNSEVPLNTLQISFSCIRICDVTLWERSPIIVHMYKLYYRTNLHPSLRPTAFRYRTRWLHLQPYHMPNDWKLRFIGSTYTYTTLYMDVN